jgi:hypothetical protein
VSKFPDEASVSGNLVTRDASLSNSDSLIPNAQVAIIRSRPVSARMNSNDRALGLLGLVTVGTILALNIYFVVRFLL